MSDIVAPAEWPLHELLRDAIHRDVGIPATGKDIALSGINIYRVMDGKIKENHETVDIYGLLQQIGGVPKS